MSSTKYTKIQPNYRVEQYKLALQDRPIAIAFEEYEDDVEEVKTCYCNYCNPNLSKLDDKEYWCNHYSSTVYPGFEDVGTKHKLETPDGPNQEALISYSPEPDALSKPEVKKKGGFAKK